jgi:flagellar hook-basal body complex protein FliE
MAVSPIGNIFNAIGFAQPTAATNPATDATGAAGANGSGGVAGNDGNAFMNMLDGLQGTQENADRLAVQAATGNLTDIHNYTIASTEAQIMTELTVAVRDKAVAAFEEIMRMQA